MTTVQLFVVPIKNVRLHVCNVLIFFFFLLPRKLEGFEHYIQSATIPVSKVIEKQKMKGTTLKLQIAYGPNSRTQVLVKGSSSIQKSCIFNP
jgi:hypothetical protein